ncbi:MULTISPECIES: SDR family NAD(P)-dependent oxidoreductase [Bifidobacterium]|jgi:NAD(P)-dependent dehydrogenase (short-subunit alcohol dehydrogenase family)|uniref:SDR family NAD(P)-dependent oxidoreductase n=1 Tax=Bifidobacterium tibiigranuli TaxID=2172043 RepID=A0A5N6S458_9BIFI|nr:SDR family NAD(P)-dependent oxidoreductase [Bifidobacterium tibiigranuli]KAE8129270.1 SDR family NAD(P)-dependent oxidoreductase [Bifidobacterium tibiigranuli]KAE8129508.1 oxidoreductase [Bifidobacterium tibiigranuli]
MNTNRTIIITGASDGIGAEAARQLAATGAQLIIVGRSAEKTQAVAKATGAEYHLADFTRLDEVRKLAATLNDSCERIDVLANNAGGIFSGPTTTTDGFEKTFQVNYLAPYLLTYLLIDKLIDSRAAVVNTSSIAARSFGKINLDDLNNWQDFSPNKAYGDAKLGNILFTKGLHERFGQQGLSSVAFHPGNVATNFASDTDSYFRRIYHGMLKRVLLISPEEGGKRLRHFIDGTPGITWQSGEYYKVPKRIGRTNPQASDPNMVREHWERSADMLGIQW